MKVTIANILDRLPAERTCLAAVLTSYAFDPRVFEEQVLRAVLDLRSDPVNETPRFLMEGRARLQQTPVSVIVDAGQRIPGRRMPYDVLEVVGEVFHPKTVLLLYEDHARLQIGSGNVTDGGYGGNAELFVLLELRYEDPTDAALLRRFDEFLGRCVSRARHEGTQLASIRQKLHRCLPKGTAATTGEAYALLETTLDRPMLDQIFDLLPDGAKIRRVGMLAPFFESDTDAPSVLDRVLELVGPEVELDVGMAWDNPPPVCRQPEVPTLEQGLGRLWCWRSEYDSSGVEFFVPTRVLRTRYEALDQWGKLQYWSLDEAEMARTSKRTWPIETIEAFAPARILRRAADRFSALRMWLFPAATLHEGLPRHRPLHAKLIVIAFEHARKLRTLVVVGSANLSRSALLRSSDGGGNIECALAFCMEGLHRLHDLADPLVHVPLELLELRERQYPELGTNFGLCIERAVHDPAQATLDVIWDRQRSASVDLPRWELRYGKEAFASGYGAPTVDHHLDHFTLRTDEAELLLVVKDREFSIPILVTDLARLPVRPIELEMSLHTMLLVLGGRLGRERAAALEEQVRRSSAPVGEGAGLDTIFGEGFGPVDVFRAWWGACAELRNPHLSLAAFRVAIVGTLGLQAVWTKIRSAMEAEPPQLPRAAGWFYGAELLRELERIRLGNDPTGRDKAAMLEPFVEQLRGDLTRLAPHGTSEPYMRRVLDFYGVRP